MDKVKSLLRDLIEYERAIAARSWTEKVTEARSRAMSSAYNRLSMWEQGEFTHLWVKYRDGD